MSSSIPPIPGLTQDAWSRSGGQASPPGLPGPLADAATRLTMQRSLDFFDFYWQGRRNEWMQQDGAGLRAPLYSQMPVPRTRTAPRDPRAQPLGTTLLPVAMDGGVGGVGGVGVDQQRQRRRAYGGQPNRERNRALRRDVLAGAYGGLVNFTQPLDLELKRVLGKGGQGIACLFTLTLPDGTKTRLVVKGSLGEGDISRELNNMRQTAGAMHVIQRQYMRSLPTARAGSQQATTATPGPSTSSGAQSTSGPATAGMKHGHDDDGDDDGDPRGSKVAKQGEDPAAAARLFDTQRNMYAMEYMRYGDIFQLLQRYGLENRYFTSQDLWEVFHCLFRGCVGMAYPGRWARGLDPSVEDVPMMYEWVPVDQATNAPLSHSLGLVHFDLDIQNSMVGDFDDAHPTTPIVKIGDLGLAARFSINERRDFLLMLRKRKSGKPSIYTPEQNTKEWDYLHQAPFIGGFEPTAGNYDFWSNLYQVALIMWQMVTIAQPDVPPQCSHVTFRAIGDTDRNMNVWTYGGLLLQSTHETELQDVRLRRAIALCMAHRPSQRIGIDQLQQVFDQMCDDNIWENGEDYQEHKTYMRDILVRPPPSTAAVPQLSQDLDEVPSA